MKTWQRLLLIVLIGSYPTGIYILMRSGKFQMSAKTLIQEGITSPTISALDQNIGSTDFRVGNLRWYE